MTLNDTLAQYSDWAFESAFAVLVLALILLVIGGINWGLVGIFELDLVAWLFGGAASIISRVIYILVALSAVWCVTFLFRSRSLVHSDT